MGLKQMWAEARYRKLVDDWIAAIEAATAQAHHAQAAAEGGFTSDRVRIEPGERLCGQFNASLSETRRVRVTNWGSASHQTSGGDRVRAGQARSTSHDELQIIDSGNVVITDRRVQFLGSKHNRELRWRTLADNPEVGSGAATFRSTGRQKPLVITFHPSGTTKVAFEIDLALALFDGADDAKLAQLRNQVNELVSHPPEAPAGTVVDERVPRLASAPTTQSAGVSTPNDDGHTSTAPQQSTIPNLPRGCFIDTPPEQVAAAAAALGFTTRWMIWPGSSAMLESAGPTIIPVPALEGVLDLGVELAVLSGDEEQILAMLEASVPRYSVVVGPDAPDGIPVLDRPRIPDVVRHASPTDADLIASERRQAGAMVHRLDCNDITTTSLLQAFNCKAQLLRPMTRSPQILILGGPVELLPELAELSGFDEIIVLSEPQQQDSAESDEADLPPEAANATEHPVTVAGEVISDPAGRIRRYLLEHARTVRRYDMTAAPRVIEWA